MAEAATSKPQDLAYVVVGTAGHIDHGKSSLVRTLTGDDPDRFPEEKKRGITIDLGYAGRELPDGRTLGFIDVPGHERFIKNMVAGATGVDVTVLVVAADDGVMPQTREHVAILQLLGMKHLMVALTKCDLVDEEMVELAVDDVQVYLGNTTFAGCPVIPCSAVTGQGCEQVWETLLEMLASIQERSRQGIFRMPIQRSFSAKGFGTVVTGVPLGGTVSIGEVLEVLPLAQKGKVRGLQAYGQNLETASAGHRTAVNIADIEFKLVERGMVAATPGVLLPSRHVSVRYEALASVADDLIDGEVVRFHSGTAEVLGEVALLEGKPVPPGGIALVQIILQDPLVAVPGDRFILRRHSPMETLGGGVVLRLDERRLKRRRDWILDDLRERVEFVGDSEKMASFLLRQADHSCVTIRDLVREAAVTRRHAAACLSERVASGDAVEVAVGRFVSPGALEAVRVAVREHLEGFHAAHPERFRLETAVLRRELPFDEWLIDRALEDLETAEKVVVEQGTCRLRDLPPPSPELAAEWARIGEIFLERTFDSPRRISLAEELGWPQEKVDDQLQYLTDSDVLVRIGEDMHLHADTVGKTREALKRSIATDGELDTSEFKTQLGVSRKLLIPLLEYFDSIGLTIRDGNKRFLRSHR